MVWVLPAPAQLFAVGVPLVNGVLDVPQALTFRRHRHKIGYMLRTNLVGFIRSFVCSTRSPRNV